MKFINWLLWKLLVDQRGAAGSDDVPPETPPETPPEKPPEPTQSEEYKRLEGIISQQNQQFTQQFTQLQDNFNAMLASVGNRPPASASPEDDVSEQELDEALDQGKGAAKFTRAMDLRVRKQDKLIQAKLAEIEEKGVAAISGIAKEMALSKMPHYKKYKSEVDAYIDQLPPAAKLNGPVYKVAYDAVVGSHMDEIVKADREAILREVANPNAVTLPGKPARGQEGDEGKIPTVEELFGKEAAEALVAVGRSSDQHAQRMGYKSWAEYAKWVKGSEEEGEKAA